MKTKLIAILLCIFLIEQMSITTFADKETALKDWDEEEKSMNWLSYSLTDWGKLEEYLLHTSAIDTNSCISEPKVCDRVKDIKDALKDILTDQEKWNGYNLNLWEGADDIEDYIPLLQCVIDTIGKKSGTEDEFVDSVGDNFEIDPCQVVKYNVLNCANTYTTDKDTAEDTSLILIDGNTSVAIFMNALFNSIKTWSLQTGQSKTKITPYTFDGNLKACVANVYFPQYLSNYASWYEEKKGTVGTKKRAYGKQFSGAKYYEKYKDTECYQYIRTYTKSDNSVVNKNKKIASAGNLIESMADKYVSSNVTVSINNQSKLSSKEIQQYLDKAKAEGADNDALEVLSYALARVGWNYVYGAAHTSFTSNPNPKAYDCSSFVSYAWASAGYDVSQGRKIALTASGLAGMKDCGVTQMQLKPGDICACSNHASIYLGDGKIVHASSTKSGIKIGDLQSNMAWHAGQTWVFKRPTKIIKKDESLANAISKYK